MDLNHYGIITWTHHNHEDMRENQDVCSNFLRTKYYNSKSEQKSSLL